MIIAIDISPGEAAILMTVLVMVRPMLLEDAQSQADRDAIENVIGDLIDRIDTAFSHLDRNAQPLYPI